MIEENVIRFVILDIGLGVGLALGVMLSSWLLRTEQKARRFVYLDEAGTVRQAIPQQHATPAASNEARMLRNEKRARTTTKKEST